MNYIVLDLEWNQGSPESRVTRKDFPFEIIELGAVKLNDNREITDRFSELICPQIHTQINRITRDIIHISEEELKNARYFQEVMKDFLIWCGEEDYIFCTWGSMDLTELQRNIRCFHTTPLKGIRGEESPIIYYDVQKLFSICYEGKKNPRTLKYAVDFLKMEEEEEFHRAYNDAFYTARIFQKLDWNVVLENYSVDYYYYPTSWATQLHLNYENYRKDIYQAYSTKEKASSDKEARQTICPACGKRAAKKIRWFSGNSKTFYCLAYCKSHGLLKGKMKVKKTPDDQYFVVKIVRFADEKDEEEIFGKKCVIQKKRKEKRLRKQNLQSKTPERTIK